VTAHSASGPLVEKLREARIDRFFIGHLLDVQFGKSPFELVAGFLDEIQRFFAFALQLILEPLRSSTSPEWINHWGDKPFAGLRRQG
jgi:hypothetical protein